MSEDIPKHETVTHPYGDADIEYGEAIIRFYGTAGDGSGDLYNEWTGYELVQVTDPARLRALGDAMYKVADAIEETQADE